MKRLIILFSMLFGLFSNAGAVTRECMTFESFSTGIQHPVGTNYVHNDIVGDLYPFQWQDGTWHFGGFGEVVNTNNAYGSGQESMLNNINLLYTFNVDQPNVATFRYADHGGNVNFYVNGSFQNTQDLSDLNGLNLGGVWVFVTRQNAPPPSNQHHGIVTLIGEIDQFAVGGQEFWVDDVCAFFW